MHGSCVGLQFGSKAVNITLTNLFETEILLIAIITIKAGVQQSVRASLNIIFMLILSVKDKFRISHAKLNPAITRAKLRAIYFLT